VLSDGSDGDAPQEWIIEINPRVTMAYVGLRRLAALNMGALLLDAKAPIAWRDGPVEFDSGGQIDADNWNEIVCVFDTTGPDEREPDVVLGLDIGGANIKAATAQGWATNLPFALWREPERLKEKLAKLLADAPRYTHVAVTMTGELCDCFHTKREGVREIVIAVMKVCGRGTWFWSTAGEFVTADVAMNEPLKVAASNWHALATMVGREFPRGLSLLVDIGSTTTDLIPIRDGQIIAQGRTDAERLMHGELLYTGAMRTPVMALGTSVMFEGRRVALMAERFATAHDVHVLTGELSEDPNDTDTADGRPVTRALCAARLARMIGADLEMISFERAVTLAQAFAAMQRDTIVRSARQALSGRQPDRVIVSGSGAFLARDVCPGVQRVNLSEKLGPAVSSAACAFAVAKLRQIQLDVQAADIKRT
jgi:probable H4MPT-linked C1 transfer pathway protein